MTLTIEDLILIAPPPEAPVDPGSPDNWEHVEGILGTTLPIDYKRFINTYGSGEFNDSLVPLNPFSSNNSMNLFCQVSFEAAERANLRSTDCPLSYTYQEGRVNFPEQCPFPLYPEPGGLLPVASGMNGTDMFWLTTDGSYQWTLVHYDWRGGYVYHQYPWSFVEFLVLWLSGEVPGTFFGSGITRVPIFCPLGQVRPRR